MHVFLALTTVGLMLAEVLGEHSGKLLARLAHRVHVSQGLFRVLSLSSKIYQCVESRVNVSKHHTCNTCRRVLQCCINGVCYRFTEVASTISDPCLLQSLELRQQYLTSIGCKGGVLQQHEVVMLGHSGCLTVSII